MSAREPYICEPQDQSQGRPATFIFLHGYADDAEGIPLALAQQFQFNHKLPYLRWLLPNAPRHPQALETAWYMPKALPNAQKPPVPGESLVSLDTPDANDDEEGILKTCDMIDSLVQQEISRGVPGERIVVGGFSQGCAVSLVWGLVGRQRNNVAGVVPLAGYFPLAGRIGKIRGERGWSETPAEGREGEKKKWLYTHGAKDILVPGRLFSQGKEELAKWVDFERDVEEHLYERMGHSTAPPQLRDLLGWLSRVVPS